MSLYDLYFSNQNKKHMRMLLTSITKENLDENIFNNIFNNTFEHSNSDNLLDINKELVENICKIYNISSIDNNDYVESDQVQQKKQEIEYKTGYISSINKLSGNRFTYIIDSEHSIKKINKLVIPIENNDVFVNNSLKLTIPELGIDTICHCDKTNVIKNRTYGYYIPENMYVQKQSNKLSISIMSLLGNDSYDDDINITNNDGVYSIDNRDDIIIGDILRSVKKNNYKIVDINDNNITFNKKLEENELIFTNIGLQNIIIYEY